MQLLPAGSTFGGRYEVIRAIGAGGMGAVYEVLHRDTQRRRALKVMMPSLLAVDELRERFAREATVTAGIESEHLVEVFDAGIDAASGAPFLVMELLRGEDLGAWLKQGRRATAGELVAMFEQLARALGKTHAAGIVHRDLKPENLFVTFRDDGSMRLKILDFGIAKLVASASQATRAIGSPLYMSPEQVRGTGIGPGADVYALGHVAFALLVGSPYFEPEAETAPNALGLMITVSAGARDPASTRAAARGVGLPGPFDAWFARSTALVPSERFPSVDAQAQALAGALGGVAIQVTALPSTPRRRLAHEATVAAATGGPSATPSMSSGVVAVANSSPRGSSIGPPPTGAIETASGPASISVGVSPPRSRRGVWVGAALGVGLLAAVGVSVRSLGGAPGPPAPATAEPSRSADEGTAAQPVLAPAGAAEASFVPDEGQGREPTPRSSTSAAGSAAPSEPGASPGAAPSGPPSGGGAARARSGAAASPAAPGQAAAKGSASPSGSAAAPPPTTSGAASTTAAPAGSVYRGPRR